MKKIAAKMFLALILILLPISAFATEKVAVMYEQWQEKKDGVVIEDREKTTQLIIPSPGATPEEIEKIIQRERAKLALTIKKQNEKLLEEKDAQTAEAIKDQNSTLNNLIGEDGIFDKMNKSLASMSNDLYYLAKTFWVALAILLLSIFLLIGVSRILKKIKVMSAEVGNIHDHVIGAGQNHNRQP